MKTTIPILGSLVMLIGGTALAQTADAPLAWPEASNQCRPWAYNWWMASAVDEKNLAKELERYRAGGLGGIHIIPIYGAKGYDEKYIDYLSPKWMRMFEFTVREAKRLGMGVDMTTGTGWCFGGPNISKQQAGMIVECKPIALAAGETLTRKFKPDSILSILAVGADGQRIDLTSKVDRSGEISWKPAGQAWKVYPLVVRGSGPKVKRSAPGGAGYMLNPFYGDAMKHYLEWFDPVFPAGGAEIKPRAMYHDSYEYGSQWSPDLLPQFEKRRGYRLQDHLPELFANGETDASARVRADFQETVSDMMVENVFPQWTEWCRARGILTRYQAHGSPGNLLDLYALADVPETEMFGRGKRDPLVSRFEPGYGDEGDREVLVSNFASSAAHVAGRKLTASETGTWMAEHFCETLEEMKCLVDLFFVSGINHVFYHGCCYSPDEAAWPGWCFYAATEMNPRNAIWHDVPALNAYITRCQSVLQSGRPDNDILLYWPIEDLWHEPGHALVSGLVVHDRGKRWLGDQPIGKIARRLWSRGFTFDYVSDRQLTAAKADHAGIAVPGGAYRAVLVPTTRHMPPETLRKLLQLAETGATVIFQDQLPADVPGLAELEKRRGQLAALKAGIRLEPSSVPNVKEAKLGGGRILVGEAEACLALAGIEREAIAEHEGTLFVRRAYSGGKHYFIANQGGKPLDGWVPLAARASAVAVMDPMTGTTGMATTRMNSEGRADVYLQLAPGASTILRTFADQRTAGDSWKYSKPAGEPIGLNGRWTVKFIQGGPTLPKPYETATLDSWTKCGDPEAERFAGSAVYTLHFDAPKGDSFLLDLGRVCHSARVRLNSRELGTLIMAPYRIRVESLKPTDNLLEVEVTNLSANRIRDLDRRKVDWRVFNEINIVNIGYKKFDASQWPVFDSGLMGPVTLQPIRAH